jgi:hypothetical protein
VHRALRKALSHHCQFSVLGCQTATLFSLNHGSGADDIDEVKIEVREDGGEDGIDFMMLFLICPC